MQKILFLVLLSAFSLFSNDLANGYIALQSRIYSQLLGFSTTLDTTQIISFAIIYDSESESSAEEFKAALIKNNENSKSKKIDIIMLHESQFKQTIQFQVAYIVGDTQNIKNILAVLNKKSIITLAGNEKVLKSGALFGLRTGSKTQVMLNKATFQSGKFFFNQSLIKMVKVYEEN